MSDDKRKSSVQRFGRGNRKNSLEKPASLFPEEPKPAQDGSLPPFFPGEDLDIDSIEMPDPDTEALEKLSSVDRYVKAPVITPSEERFPAIAPSNEPERDETAAPATSIQPMVKQTSSTRHNLITMLTLLLTILFGVWFWQVWTNPQTALNPLAPSTPFLQVSVTPGGAASVVIDATPDEAGQVFVVITDTPSAEPAAPVESDFPFVVEPVIYAPNSNELGCNWWSIAGTVRDLEGNPLDGYRIRVTPQGSTFAETVFSGASQAFGAGGYELPLVGTPQVATFTVQLYSPQNAPLSDEISVTTRDTCDGNVLILNFLQNR